MCYWPILQLRREEAEWLSARNGVGVGGGDQVGEGRSFNSGTGDLLGRQWHFVRNCKELILAEHKSLGI